MGPSVFLIVFGVYLFTMSPGLTSDDSGELAGVCATLGIAHPSGYPLYSITGKIFNFLFPFGNPAYRANLVSVFFAAITAYVVFLIIKRWSAAAGVVLSLLLCAAHNFWEMGIVTEVYMLNAAISALILYFILDKNKGEISKRYFLVSLLAGLALTNHFTAALIFPAIIVWFLFNFSEIRQRNIGNSSASRGLRVYWSPELVRGILFFITGLLVYLFIPVRANCDPVYSWEDPKTYERFLYLVTRSRYGGQLAQGNPLPVTLDLIVNNLLLFTEVLVENFTPVGAVLLVIFVLAAFFKHFKESIILFTAMFFSGPGFFIIARMPAGQQIKELFERFVYLPFIPLCIMAGMGFSVLTLKLKNKIPVATLVVIIPIYLFAVNFSNQTKIPLLPPFPKGDISRRNDFIYYDYAKNILRNAPRNAIIFSDRADEMEFCTSYLIRAHNYRKDLTFIDCNAGVSKSIYGDDYYKIWGKPRLARRLEVESKWIKRAEKEGGKVFYSTFEPKMIDLPRVRYGLLCEMGNKKPELFRWDEIFSLRQPLKQDSRSVSLYEGFFYLTGKYFLDAGFPEIAKRQMQVPAIVYNKPQMLIEIPWWYFNAGNFANAENEYLYLLQIKDNWPEVYVNLGVVYEKQSKLSLSMKSYAKAIELNPEYAQAYYNLGVLHWRKSDWKKVAENFQKVVDLQPENAEARKYLSLALEKVR